MRLRTAGAIALVVTMGCVSSSKYEKKAKEATASDQRAQEAAAKAAACEAKVATLEQDLQQVTAARDRLALQAATLTEEKGELEAKSAQYEELSRSLKEEIEAGRIEVTDVRGRMLVKLRDQVLFRSGSAKLSADGRKMLDQVAAVFKDMQGKSVIVAGYTDDVPVARQGPFGDNWDLSTARAASVVRYLASKGVPPETLGVAGFSQFRPLVPNDSPEHRSQNRRIEIGVTPMEASR